jgi:Asp/Glu/hydantoin racemase
MFWEWKKDSHLYCNPNECQKMTEWLLKEVENCQQKEASITAVSAWHTQKNQELQAKR